MNKVGPGYYSYDGSLTTPTCNQVVTFIVMEKTIAISQEQVRNFERLLTNSSDSFTNLEFRIHQYFQRIFIKVSFSTVKQNPNSWKKFVKQIGEMI